MKNLFLIPTDKPSRLISSGKEFTLLKNPTTDKRCKKIYITSDEEIKEGDWCIDIIHNIIVKRSDDRYKKQYKKIILTTDPSLAPDVQKIDDEFLEWFVKNSNCEFVEIKGVNFIDSKIGIIKNHRYKIIIPKEEQKQHLIDIMRGDEELGLYEQIDQNNPVTKGSTALVKEIKLEDIFNDEKREGAKRIIHQHKVLKDLTLVNPAHLQMTSNGHGEFPDGYKLTHKGIQYIIEQLNKE